MDIIKKIDQHSLIQLTLGYSVDQMLCAPWRVLTNGKWVFCRGLGTSVLALNSHIKSTDCWEEDGKTNVTNIRKMLHYVEPRCVSAGWFRNFCQTASNSSALHLIPREEPLPHEHTLLNMNHTTLCISFTQIFIFPLSCCSSASVDNNRCLHLSSSYHF